MDLAPSTLAQWAGAIATSAAVLVALFRDWLLGLFWYPTLSLRILPEARAASRRRFKWAMLAAFYGQATLIFLGCGLRI